METKIDEFKRILSESGFIGKTVKDVLINYNSLYHRIYNYAKKNSIWLPKLFHDLGLILDQVKGVDSVKKLDIFIKDIFHYENKDWSNIPTFHKNFIKETILELDIRFDVFLARYNITNRGTRIYQSVDEIKSDLVSKGLNNASILEIKEFDGGKTMSNIESFTKSNSLKMKDVWFALNIAYADGILVCETGVKKDFVYHNDAEMMQDVISKGLIGKTKKELWNYDNGTTDIRIRRYAKRCEINISKIWEKLGVKDSPKQDQTVKIEVTTLDELRILVKKRGLIGKSIKEVKEIDPDISFYVKKIARCGCSMKDIWKDVGIIRSQGFESVDDIVDQIHVAGFRTAKEIRSDLKFYKRISGFVERNDVTTIQIWERAGISYYQTGRPSK